MLLPFLCLLAVTVFLNLLGDFGLLRLLLAFGGIVLVGLVVDDVHGFLTFSN
jgi:hypothetical protein